MKNTYILQLNNKLYGSGSMKTIIKFIDDYLVLHDNKDEIDFKITEYNEYLKNNQIAIDMTAKDNLTMRQQLTKEQPAICGVTKLDCAYCCPCCEHRKNIN